MGEDDKNRGAAVVVDHHHQHHDQQQQQHHGRPPLPPPEYGTFQGVANYPTPAIGFPQPVPPPGAVAYGSSAPPPQYYAQGYQTVTGYAVVADERPGRERRLPCCGLGVGWCLFIIGFFLGAIPWYIGLFVLMCGRIDHREKPGYIACTIAAILATIVIVIGATKGAHEW